MLPSPRRSVGRLPVSSVCRPVDQHADEHHADQRRGSSLVVLLVILALLAVLAGLWWWNQQRQFQAEMEARDQLKKLNAIVQMNSSQKHVGTLLVRQELDKVLPWIGQLNYLSHLDVADTQLTDDQLDSIASLPRLYSLDVSNTRLTDDGVAKLTGLPLETIFLAGTKITGETLPLLAQIKTLKIVGLKDTAIQDQIAALTSLPKLEWIVLDGVDLSKIDQQTLDSLAQMPMLRRLSVLNTGIPEASLKRLQSAKPALKIDAGTEVKTVNPGAATPAEGAGESQGEESAEAESTPEPAETDEDQTADGSSGAQSTGK